MKNIKVILGVVLIFIVSVVGYISWKELNKSPEKSTEIYLDAIFKYDKNKIKKIGITEEEYNLLIKQEEDILMSKLQESPLACVLVDSEKYKHIFLNNIMNGLAKLEYKVELISKSNDNAKVAIKTNYFELNKIIKEAQEKMAETFKNNPSMSSDEMIKESYRIVEEEFKKGPSEGSEAVITVDLIKKDNIWIPYNNFEKDICDIILQ